MGSQVTTCNDTGLQNNSTIVAIGMGIPAMIPPVKKSEEKKEEEKNTDNENKFKYEHNPSDNPKVLEDALEDPRAVYGYSPRGDGSLKKFVKYDWSNPDVVKEFRDNRIKYHIDNEKNKEFITLMRNNGLTDKEIAKILVEKRNETRLASYFNENGEIIDQELYNQAKEHCVTYKELSEGYKGKPAKTDLEIIESSIRGNPGMDACCGLYDDYYHTYK